MSGMINENILRVLQGFIVSLQKIYGNNLYQVILFGSYARGDYTENSDIDVMILLNLDEINVNDYDDALCEETARLLLTENVFISPVTASYNKFYRLSSIHTFYKNVIQDGLMLYDSRY